MKDDSKVGVGKPKHVKPGGAKVVAGKTVAVRKRPASAGPTASVEAAVDTHSTAVTIRVMTGVTNRDLRVALDT